MAAIGQLRPQSGFWSKDERSVLATIQLALREQGIDIRCNDAMTADGSPWTAFYAPNLGSFLAHVIRERDGYAVIWPDRVSAVVDEIQKLVEVICNGWRAHTVE